MNVIVSNKQKEIIDNANIDAIKDFNGLFNVDDLISKVKNYFYSKLILDATSIVNFSSKEVLEKLASSIGADRLVILLPTEQEPPKEFVDLLTSLKIYNFSTKIADVVRFINVPNTYENIVGDSNGNQPDYYIDNSIKASDNFTINNNNNTMNVNSVPMGNSMFDPVITDSNVTDNLQNDNVNSFGSQGNIINNIPNDFDINLNNNLFSNQNNINNQDMFVNDNSFQNAYKNGIPNNLNNEFQNVNYLDNNQMNTIPNNAANNFINNQMSNNFVQDNVMNNTQNVNDFNNNNIQTNFYQNFGVSSNSFVLGFKNITSHAGSTTLIYLLMKEAREKLNLNVSAIEVGKNDFRYYNDASMISCTDDNVREMVKNSNANLILIDLNDFQGNIDFLNDVLYLVEPSVIKLNSLMMNNRFVFRENANNKLVLNKSFLNSNEVLALSKEAGINFVMNIPPINDRAPSSEILLDILSSFGFK